MGASHGSLAGWGWLSHQPRPWLLALAPPAAGLDLEGLAHDIVLFCSAKATEDG